MRKSPTLEFVDYLRAAYGETQPFSFHGDEFHTDNARISVQPLQRPHPPLWMMSRDPQTLEFCARNGINPGYFLIYPRADAAPRFRKFLQDWDKLGIAEASPTSPIAPSSMWTRPTTRRCDTDCCARAAPMRAFCRRRNRAKRSTTGSVPTPRNSSAAASPARPRSWRNLFDPDYLMKHELVFIGSPETVAGKIRAAAKAGVFNTFLGRVQFLRPAGSAT